MLRANLHEQEIRRAIGAPGDGDLVVQGVAPLDAGEDRCLYFVNHDLTMTVRDRLASLSGCIVIVPPGAARVNELGECRVLVSARPRAAIARVLGVIESERRLRAWVAVRRVAPGAVISPLAVVDGDVEIGEGAVIEPFCTVGPDVVIGRGSVVRTGARLHPRVSVGEESVIGANAVIGCEGFGFVRDETGNKTRIPHLGGVVIGSHVEIGALTAVQCGTLTPTLIGDHVKIDVSVAIGHNARIAPGASLVGGCVVGGSAAIEADAWIGMNATIRDGRRVGSGGLVGMDASVQHDLEDRGVARAPRPSVGSRSADDDDTSIGFAGRPPRPPA